ncbi:MAG: MBL fold metallo-hydrolase [Lachnospiraceae bacterium]|nr:MBL fold metallo-hydrolase [Lachnospiraceae bacterium]
MTGNIEVFKQNSIRIRSRVGVIYTDPFQMKEELKDADFVLITHDHYDHFSPEDIGKVSKADTILVVPEKMATKAQEVSGMVGKIETVKPSVYREMGGLEFETVPAYNTLKPFHPKSAEWVGYILRIDGKRIYIAGDTDATKEAKAVKCDIALVPIGGTYTMDAKKAAELINTIRPDVAIPVHYGHIVGKPGDGEVFAENVMAPIKVELKIAF